jgi:enoyl-CoA hydratase/carnithine racemase
MIDDYHSSQTLGRLMDSELVRLECANGVAVVTVDNPPVNAMSVRVLEGLLEASSRCMARPGIRAIILTGAGSRCFMAGADIKELPLLKATPGASQRRLATARKAFDSWSRLKQPTIAAVQGTAVGGGLEMALTCDFIVADKTAKFGLPEVKLGLIPGSGGNTRLVHRVGPARAKALCMIGETISAARALDIGLIDHATEPGEAFRAAREFAEVLASRPAVAVQMVKQVVDGGIGVETADALQLELAAYEVVASSQDAEEGCAAFLEHRPPRFRHC